jgi:4-hydroxybenzoate polyprenyltransferase
MKDRPALIALLIFMTLCGVLIVFVIYISPNPTPPLHAQVLTAFIALFLAAGYAFVKRAAGHPRASSRTRKPPEGTARYR